jgi:hypothetical protein
VIGAWLQHRSKSPAFRQGLERSRGYFAAAMACGGGWLPPAFRMPRSSKTFLISSTWESLNNTRSSRPCEMPWREHRGRCSPATRLDGHRSRRRTELVVHFFQDEVPGVWTQSHSQEGLLRVHRKCTDLFFSWRGELMPIAFARDPEAIKQLSEKPKG